MKVVPGNVVRTAQGWSISKLNRNMHALGNDIGNDLLVISVRDNSDDAELCVLSPKFGPVWVHNDDRRLTVIR